MSGRKHEALERGVEGFSQKRRVDGGVENDDIEIASSLSWFFHLGRPSTVHCGSRSKA